MDDFYIILSKHFTNEATEEEEKVVYKFKQENPKEYLMLYQLWMKQGIEIQEFDLANAWNQIKPKMINKHFGFIPINWNIKNAAASIVFFIIITLSGIYLYNNFISQDKVVIKNTSNGSKLFKLEDSSRIWLSSNSSVSFNKELIQETREITLSGKGYFDVVKKRQCPFIVKTQQSTITVLGTSFYVNSSENITEVSVKSGIVKVESEISDENIVLNPNQSALVDNGILSNFETQNENYLSWLTSKFEFKNTPLIQVINDLNTYYNNKIIISSSFTSNCNLTAVFKKLELSDVIEIIETTCDVKFDQVNNTFILR